MAAPGGSKRKAESPAKHSKRAKNEAANNNNNASSKRQLKHERQSTRRHADVVASAKEVWNKLRQKTNTAEMNRKLMDELMPLIRGKVNQIALQHDASRVVQAAIQFGTKEERQEITKELTASANSLAELSKSQYAHFCVLKLVKYCHTDPVSTKLILKNFRTHMPSLAVHAVASRVVESLWVTFGEKKMAALRYELYGPHFGLFVADAEASPKSLKELLQDDSSSKKEKVLSFLLKWLQKGMEKSLCGFTYFQEFMAEYCDVASGSEIRQNLCSTAADHAIHLLAGRAGTRAAASLATYSTPKDRKALLKSLKGYALSGLLHRDAYLAIIRLVQLTDDTVTVNKYILQELLTMPKEDTEKGGNITKEENDENKSQHPLLQLALSDTGSKFLLMQLTDAADRKFLDPYESSIVGDENPVIRENDDKEVPTSKKEPSLRRSQVLDYIKDALVEVCVENAKELLLSRSGSSVLRHIYSALGRPAKLVNAVIEVCRQQENDGTSIFEDPLGHLALKQLILEDANAKEKTFGKAFVEAFESDLANIVRTNRGAFVVVALCKVGFKDEVQEKVKSDKLKKLAKTDGPKAGFEALLKELK